MHFDRSRNGGQAAGQLNVEARRLEKDDTVRALRVPRQAPGSWW